MELSEDKLETIRKDGKFIQFVHEGIFENGGEEWNACLPSSLGWQ
jgi:hypothetical protein